MTDINKNKIIFRLLPLGLHKYITLLRIDRPIGFMLLFYPASFGVVISSKINLDSLYLLLTFLIGSIIMRSAGCIINDIWDRKIDVKVKRTKTRPIASGEIKIINATIILFILLLIGFLILISFNYESILLGILIFPLVILYPLAKKYFFFPQLVLGFIYNWGIFIGWSSTQLYADFNAVITLYISCVIWTIIYDTVYATQDEEDDMRSNLYSSAILFGEKKKAILSFLIIVQFLLLALVGKFFNYSYFYFILISIIGTCTIIDLNFKWNNDINNSLNFFKRHNIYGLLILISLAFGNNLVNV